MLLSVVLSHPAHNSSEALVKDTGPWTQHSPEIALIKFCKDFCFVKHNYHLTAHQHLPQLPVYPLDVLFTLEFVKRSLLYLTSTAQSLCQLSLF